jgi:UBX domain-containing protein 1
VRTLRDLQASADDDDDEDEDKKKRDLFAGGEKSGLAVQDPSRGGSGGRGTDHFQNILSQARNNAPRAPGGDDDDEEEPAGPSRPSNFSGRAQTLGGDDAPSRIVADPAAPVTGRRPGAAALPRISRTMHLWADGVSIDDGPLFRFDDPANQPLMEQINQGHAPLSMLDVQPGQEVDLNLDPHKDENYVKPKPKYKPFSGSGQRLGSPTPGVAAASSSSITAAPAPAQQPAASSTSAGPVNEIDESVPTITLQIRLGDGSRVQSRFNTTQTIGDVYNFVSRTSAASGDRQWALMTTFPSKELEDKSVVLGDMSDFKRGGVVVQKWK